MEKSMANPKPQDSQLADSANNPMIGSAQTLIADHALAYTTDDPGLTAANTTTIADGDGTLVTAEVLQGFTDLSAKINAILDVLEAHGLMKDA